MTSISNIAGARDLGMRAAAERFKIATGPDAQTGGAAGSSVGNFLRGQWQALKELPGHLRGGLGGAPSIPSEVGHLAPGAAGPLVDMGELHRQRALGNIRSLLPSIAVGSGIYALHKYHQAKQQAQAQQAQAQQAEAQWAAAQQAAAQQAMLMGGYGSGY